ncbi:MAG TPA: hypothetical protein VGJ14_08115 [Sporichthyaceae bacterium]|jgi:hypothetical protein
MAVRRGQKQDEKLPVQAGPKEAAAPAAEQAGPAVPAQPKVENVQDQIRRLATLRQLGVLDNQEFEDLTALLLDLPRA